MKSVFILLNICAAVFALTFNPACAEEMPARVTGTVEEIQIRNEGMNFYYLFTKSGEEIFLGDPLAVQNDTKKLCVYFAAETGEAITLEGVLLKDGSIISFRDNDYVCAGGGKLPETEGIDTDF